ncbi:MAG: family N-acetyltransferase [Acidimicrobiaceae bacterium]|nr:family N-acetyltransferase [Acidimicrobiaceae bacterium]
MPVLSGSHVRLAPLILEHVPGLVAAASEDPSLYRLTVVPLGEPAMRAYVVQALEAQARGECVPFVVQEVATERVIGSTRFLDLATWPLPEELAAARPDPPGPVGVEIGSTWLAASARRTGVNTEMKLLLLRHAFEVWGVIRVTLKTDARNVVSRAAIERLGAVFEGIRRADREGADHLVRDSAYYSILAAEWPDVRARLEGYLAEQSRPS